MADAVAKIARPPQMRGFLHSAIKKNIIVASVLAAITGVAMKVFYNDVRKQKYADFYRTYDAEADFNQMRLKGLFQSCK